MFCWTRMGTESGMTVDEIVVDKEAQRRQAGGPFLWGIGNRVGLPTRGYGSARGSGCASPHSLPGLDREPVLGQHLLDRQQLRALRPRTRSRAAVDHLPPRLAQLGHRQKRVLQQV